MYAFAVMIGSLIVGKLLAVLGRKTILIFGLALMGISMISFGFITYIHSKIVLIVVSLGIRGLQGFSSSMIQTTSYAIIAIIFKDNQQKYLGYLESSMGVGLITGPMIGSAIYSLFGFEATFFVIGGIFIILAPLLFFVIPKSVNEKDQDADYSASHSGFIRYSSAIYRVSSRVSHRAIQLAHKSDFGEKDSPLLIARREKNNKNAPKEPVKYYKVLLRPIFLTTSLATFLSYFWSCYMEPVMALRLDEFDLSPFWIGAFFSIASLMYTISSLMVACFAERIDNKLLIFLGMLFNGFSHIVVGPSPYLPDSLILMWVGQVVHGFTVTFFLITWLPVMINDAVIGYPRQKNEVTDMSSAIFNSMLGIGQMLGPIYGSIVTDEFNFRVCADSVAVVVLGYALIYFFVSLCCKPKPKTGAGSASIDYKSKENIIMRSSDINDSIDTKINKMF